MGTIATVEHVLPSAEITLSQASGTMGSVISINGTGFPISVPPSSVSFLGTDLALPGFLSTNSIGEIALDVQLTELLPAGTGQMALTIGATTASAPFEKIPATLTASRTTELILFTGTGFPRNTFVSSVIIDGQKLSRSVITDENGEFSINYLDPPTSRVDISVTVANTRAELAVP